MATRGQAMASLSNTVATDIECPYCHVPLRNLTQFCNGRSFQQVIGDGESKMIVQLLPETHYALGCPECFQGFFTPKNREAFIVEAQS